MNNKEQHLEINKDICHRDIIRGNWCTKTRLKGKGKKKKRRESVPF